MVQNTILVKEQAYQLDNPTDKFTRLKDGRNLGYAEYGNIKGDIVFYFHGSPSSRLEAAAMHETAIRLNVRIISVDRPGMGLSTFQNGRHILNFADDISELANILDINHFSVMGMSGGGPYVLACAYMIPQRINAAGIINGIGPIDERGITEKMIVSTRLPIWLSLRLPFFMKFLFSMMVYRLRRKRDLFFWKSLLQPDQATLSLPFIGDIWIDSILEAFRCGTIGPVLDMGLFEKYWGFNPEEINIPIHIWHGELDRNVPIEMARRLAERIPFCHTKFYSHESHFSLWLNQMEDIIETLVSQ